MHPVAAIFTACDAAEVTLWREGDNLKWSGPRGLPDALARDIRTHKLALLAHIPHGFGWHKGGAILHAKFRTSFLEGAA